MPLETKSLVRAVGRWSLAALMLNTVVGSSVLEYPSLLAAYLGKYSPAGYLVTAVGIAAIAACLAEVASQFRETGGPYLYARAAFGPFVALQIGWLTWLTRIAAASAVADLFVAYLIHFFPTAEVWVVRATVLALLVGFLAVTNYRGVTSGTWLSNFFTVTKVLVVLLFITAGFVALVFRPAIRVTPQPISATSSNWLEAILLMIASFGGFEAAFFLSGEARDPRKDAPMALLIALATATFLFGAVQYVVIHTLPTAATAAKPLADAAQRFLGSFGASLIAAGALISVSGSLSANMLHTPRLTFAMGGARRLSGIFRRGSPTVSHSLCVDRNLRGASSDFLGGRQLSVECDPFGRITTFHIRVHCRRSSRATKKAAACQCFSPARCNVFRCTCASFYRSVGYQNSSWWTRDSRRYLRSGLVELALGGSIPKNSRRWPRIYDFLAGMIFAQERSQPDGKHGNRSYDDVELPARIAPAWSAIRKLEQSPYLNSAVPRFSRG